jgi:hypothetical protein
MGKQLRETPIPPRAHKPSRAIPRALDAAVVKAMAKSRDARFASADAMREVLERVLASPERARERLRGGVTAGLSAVAMALAFVVTAQKVRPELQPAGAQAAPIGSAAAPIGSAAGPGSAAGLSFRAPGVGTAASRPEPAALELQSRDATRDDLRVPDRTAAPSPRPAAPPRANVTGIDPERPEARAAIEAVALGRRATGSSSRKKTAP